MFIFKIYLLPPLISHDAELHVYSNSFVATIIIILTVFSFGTEAVSLESESV